MPKQPKSLIFCVHAHQPVGNFGSVFEEAYEKCYRPFFEVLQSHPRFPIAFHMSGSLLDWLETERPEFLRMLARLAGTHEIEFLGGAYYEPIYGLIPKRDLVGQLGLMRGKLEELFGKTPEGAWLTERVWEPDLVEPLLSAGVRYTVLDDAHFEKAGLRAPVTGHYSTRQGRQELDLFASMKTLRYLIPFRDVFDTAAYLHSLKAGPERVIVFADDCEKFGLWPGTHDTVYRQKWLDRFFTAMENDDRVRLYTFERYRREFKPLRSVNIPHSSYSEMMEWSGGHFDNFFEKYPESRYMKERMWQVSELVEKSDVSEGRSLDFERSKTALYRAQCNCSYWHGVFGGLYLHHLRSSVFENLIKADSWLSEGAGFELVPLGSGERWRLRQKELVSYFNARYGGAMEELDHLPTAANLLCTLQRRPESYHRFVAPNLNGMKAFSPVSIHQILGVKDKGLEKKICYDGYRKLSFLDHFFASPISREDFQRSSYKEAGDFMDGTYRAELKGPAGAEELHFERKGSVALGRKKHSLHVKKNVDAPGPGIVRVAYEIRNESREPLSFCFGVEFNFSIGELSLKAGATESDVLCRTFEDAWRGLRVRLTSDSEVLMHAVPMETVSESEGGLEGTFQQLAVLLQRTMTLDPKTSGKQTLTLEVLKQL